MARHVLVVDDEAQIRTVLRAYLEADGFVVSEAGTGGEAVETVGEWDLPLNTPLYKAFDLYMRRRG